jgi:hypothetical protein
MDYDKVVLQWMKFLDLSQSKQKNAPTNMAAVTKNRTYGKIAGFW